MAAASVSDMPRYRPMGMGMDMGMGMGIGMGGPTRLPSGRLPSRMAVMICASVQRLMPVSLSGVTFDA